MRTLRCLAAVAGYLIVAWVAREHWPGAALWIIPGLALAWGWWYVAGARGSAVVPPLVVFALALGLPAFQMGRRLWPVFHAWQPVGRQILQIFAAQWPHWLAAGLLPVVLAATGAALAARVPVARGAVKRRERPRG